MSPTRFESSFEISTVGAKKLVYMSKIGAVTIFFTYSARARHAFAAERLHPAGHVGLKKARRREGLVRGVGGGGGRSPPSLDD